MGTFPGKRAVASGGCDRSDVAATSDGWLTWRPTANATANGGSAVLQELDLLLTGGMLSEHSKRVISEAYDSELTATGAENAMKLAQQLVTIAPEFHATNLNVPGDAPR